MTNKDTIALFGGTFNPPHKGHLKIAQNVITGGLANEIIFIPAYRSPYKLLEPIASPLHRYAMLEILIKGQECLSISDYEIVNKHKVSYSYYALKVFQEAYPTKRIKFVLGSDHLATFNSWYKAREILENFDLIIFQRAGEDIMTIGKLLNLFGQRLAKQMIENIVPFNYDISSSKFRQLFRGKKDFSPLITKEVLKYIDENNLYSK